MSDIISVSHTDSENEIVLFSENISYKYNMVGLLVMHVTVILIFVF